MSTEKLFDTSLYRDSCAAVVAEDLAGLYIENGNKPLEERINARKLKIIGDKVFDPKTEKEVPGNLKRNTLLDNLEADSAESFYNNIIKGYLIVLSFSSPYGISPYKEGRINVGYKKSDDEIEFYGIPTKLSPEEILQRSIFISEFSDISLRDIQNSDQLRGISLPINLPLNENPPWDFLEEMLPLDSDAWNYIKQGKPWLIKKNALLDANTIAPKMVHMIYQARSEYDFVSAGAYGEHQMELRGWELNGKGCPGKSNSELLGNSIQNGTFAIDSFGNLRETETTWEYHTGTCVNCGASGVDVGPCSICKSCEKIL